MQIRKNLKDYRGIPLKEVDLLHFVTAKIANCDFFVTNDSDFFKPEIEKYINVVSPKSSWRFLNLN